MTTHTNKIQNEAMYINLIIQTKKKQNYITVFQINVIYIHTQLRFVMDNMYCPHALHFWNRITHIMNII